MRRFRFSTWRFKLMMFVLITICFYDLGYYNPENPITQNQERIISSGTTDEDELKAMDAP